ncbi:MAG: oxygen-independent coproporphyrinogen III oxidase [Pseudobdellovibrio sp.]
MNQLFSKYDVPAPRYTSYPTVPYWNTTPSPDQWISHVQKTLDNSQSSWSMYLHIPYCETLCTFCGCNTTTTKDHKKEQPYVELLLKEFELYLLKVPELRNKPCRQIHLGGGTPTFFSAENLEKLLQGLQKNITLDQVHFEGSVEVDPRRTTRHQLQVLKQNGINRISLGVQDFDAEVQRLVNRIQPFDITKQMTEWARELGYVSVNFDLIYGLAKQTLESMRKTTELTIQLRPDRIALYSFAMVPWIKPAQRLFKDQDLPKSEDKRKLYELSREMLLNAGYLEVGMDHFALPHDGLIKAQKSNSLHRNFMGYTDVRTDLLLGLGVSSISETPFSFHQNEKILTNYENQINQNNIATFRGHILTESDQKHRQQILQFMTEYSVSLDVEQMKTAPEFLAEMFVDGLVKVEGRNLKITEKGKPFLRNACVFFDEHLRANQPQTKIFSQSI